MEDISDIVFVARTIDDPYNELPQGDLKADINGDGIVDLQDLSDIIAYMFTILDPTDLIFLRPIMVEEAPLYFDRMLQSDDPPSGLESRRELLHIGSAVKTDSATTPTWVLNESQHQRKLETCGLATVGSKAKGDKNQEPDRSWPPEWPRDSDPLLVPSTDFRGI